MRNPVQRGFSRDEGICKQYYQAGEAPEEEQNVKPCSIVAGFCLSKS